MLPGRPCSELERGEREWVISRPRNRRIPTVSSGSFLWLGGSVLQAGRSPWGGGVKACGGVWGMGGKEARRGGSQEGQGLQVRAQNTFPRGSEHSQG